MGSLKNLTFRGGFTKTNIKGGLPKKGGLDSVCRFKGGLDKKEGGGVCEGVDSHYVKV